jgi:hypothetical protein
VERHLLARRGYLATLSADQYNAVPDGVLNDRWVQPLPRVGGTLVQRLWPLIPVARKSLTFFGRPPLRHPHSRVVNSPIPTSGRTCAEGYAGSRRAA